MLLKKEKKPEDEKQREAGSSGEEDNEDELRDGSKEGLDGVNSWGVMKNLIKFKRALKKTNTSIPGLGMVQSEANKAQAGIGKRMTKFSLKSFIGSGSGKGK